MKKFSIKEKIILVVTLLFGCTTLVFNIKNFKKDIKYIISIRENKYITKQNNDKEKSNEIKYRILGLWNTLGESIDYLKSNIKDKREITEMEILIDDSIKALNSIEDALNKNYRNTSSNLLLYTRNIRTGFINLKEILKEDNDSKDEFLEIIEQNYIKGKEEKDF
ncbi:hypothetical protein [Clostridium sp. HMP27]|uniref:hypothetical protein n=1 Tax=Clostridium sp. HMP27 TaxID=1487921 RepID=UPI00052C33EC|nr:hypothetical protein [Clostridium sp. HMP27]KGK86074.1 hypothetical protein DP68_14720 [Clostridium sp. HMP27]